jgi:ankyrin repeat protein
MLMQRMDFVAAASSGNLPAVMKGVADGEDVNSADHAGCSALHLACLNQHREVADFLLKAGANINSRDKNVKKHTIWCALANKCNCIRR